MGWREWTRWFRSRSDDDFAAEVDSHLAFEIDRLVQSGMSQADAERAARRAFGNVTSSQEQFRRSRPWYALESVGQDIRYAVRTMRRDPSFTVIAVLSLALGIGVNTTMFGVVDALLIRTPPHVKDADRVHRVIFEAPNSDAGTSFFTRQGYGLYTAIRDGVPGFEEVGAYYATGVSSGRGAEARRLTSVLATPSVFRLLGVQPARGRFFTESEELDQGDHVAVLGYDLWNSQFASDEAILGRSIDVGGVPHIIVGVAPDGFTGIDIDRVDLWLPIGVANRIMAPHYVGPQAGNYWLEMMAKRRAGTEARALADQVTTIYRTYWREQELPDERLDRIRAVVAPVVAARGPAPERDARISLWVAIVSLIVLLIASANVANLLLLRGLERSREFALRLSLGASRRRLVQQALVEGTILSVAGALGAIVLASWSAASMRTFFLPNAERTGVLDARVLAFTAIVALGTGIIAALVPALVTARRDFGPLLGAARATMSRSRLVLQRALIGVQVTLATMLLVGAGLFVTSLTNVRAVDLGLDVDHLLYVRLDAPATYLTVLERVRQLPGVASAAVTAGEPLASGWGVSLKRRGQEPLRRGSPVPFGRAVGTDYFVTMGTRLIRGRYFTAADHHANANVAVVDEATAARIWPGTDPLDPCVYLGSDDRCTEIVGVVANTVLWQITGERGMIVYVPIEAWPEQAISMMEVRTSGDPEELIPALRQVIAAAAPGLPWIDIKPLAEWIAPQVRPWRLAASMFTAFGVLALLLAAVGLYGMLSYIVARRTQELGIRRALGAGDRGVVAMVIRGGLWMTVPGIVVGVAVALAAGRLLASELYGVAPHDLRAIMIGALSLLVVTVIACVAPARRATKVDPMVTLRSD